jgi:hypothetical protein
MPISNNMLIFAQSRSKPVERVTQMLQHVILYDLGILSTLPQYYLKLGFETYAG